MSELLTVDQLVAELRSINSRQAKGLQIIHDFELAADEASRTLDWARANAMFQVQGKNADEKKAAVELQVCAEREAYDLAKAAHTYAKAKAKSLEMAQMSTQSQLSAVRSTYMIGGN
jgi:hypothetical protein